MKTIKYFFAAIMLLVAGIANAISSPITLLENTSNQVFDAIKVENVDYSKNPKAVYKIVDRILLPHVDTYGMSRSALGRETWGKASPSQRTLFSKEFTRLMVRTYSGALAAYQDERVEFLPMRGSIKDQKRLQVHSKVYQKDGPAIPVSYRVVRKGDDWKVYDLSVEGISILQSFRSQFAAELTQGSLDDLIKKLKNMNARNL